MNNAEQTCREAYRKIEELKGDIERIERELVKQCAIYNNAGTVLSCKRCGDSGVFVARGTDKCHTPLPQGWGYKLSILTGTGEYYCAKHKPYAVVLV